MQSAYTTASADTDALQPSGTSLPVSFAALKALCRHDALELAVGEADLSPHQKRKYDVQQLMRYIVCCREGVSIGNHSSTIAACAAILPAICLYS